MLLPWWLTLTSHWMPSMGAGIQVLALSWHTWVLQRGLQGLLLHCSLTRKSVFSLCLLSPHPLQLCLQRVHPTAPLCWGMLVHWTDSQIGYQQDQTQTTTVSVIHFFFYFILLYFIFKFYLFIFVCAGSSLLRAGFLQLPRAGTTLCCGAWASHCGGFSCCGARALGTRASVVVAHGLQSTISVVVAHGLSCSVACGIFPNQGLNPCSLHWQVDS